MHTPRVVHSYEIDRGSISQARPSAKRNKSGHAFLVPLSIGFWESAAVAHLLFLTMELID